MNEKKLLVAIHYTKDICDSVSIVKNVPQDKYNQLLNQQNKFDSAKELVKQAKEERLNENTSKIKKLFKRDVLLAKSVYDNFVDRGLLENDENFQQLWFDFYFNDKELDLSNAPKEYKKILAKVESL